MKKRGRKPKPLKERLLQHIRLYGECHLFHSHPPVVRYNGTTIHPVHGLLREQGIDTRFTRLERTCANLTCVNPQHFVVIPFSNRDMTLSGLNSHRTSLVRDQAPLGPQPNDEESIDDLISLIMGRWEKSERPSAEVIAEEFQFLFEITTIQQALDIISQEE